MSRQIDFSKPLSDKDRAWLEERGLGWQIETAPDGVEVDSNASAEEQLKNVPNTGTVNTAGATIGGNLEPNASLLGNGSDDDGGDGNANGETKPYSEWTKAELVTECEARKLPHSGTKDELISRLKAADDQEQ